MYSNQSAIPIEYSQLAQYLERASRLLASVKWTPKDSPAKSSSKATTATPSWRDSSGSGSPAASQELSLIKIAKNLSKDPLLLTEELNHALTHFRQGLCLGMHLSSTYTKFSGLDQLTELNARGALTDGQKTEFREKYQTASAIAIFITCYYTAWELSSYRVDELGSIELDFPTHPEVSLANPVQALDCLLFYYGSFLENSGQINTSLEAVKWTLDYCQSVLAEIQIRAESLKFAESFTGQRYKLEQSEFSIAGFAAELNQPEASVEFNRVTFDEIVGNRDAKHDAKRLAARLLCYDPATRKNPIFDLGGLSPVTMGFGEPGTGKSMLISALATMLGDYCAQFGLPFLFWPMPDTVVSTFQGGSAERMMNWMRPLKDPTKIIYAPIDDAENNLEDRSRQGVSSGVREVIAVFLRNTEGAYAVHHGNTVIQLFTNLPEQIDKAVLSRINARTYIGGAKTREDFLDQDYLWLKKHRKLDSDFVSQTDPSDYTYLSAQKALPTLTQLLSDLREPEDLRISSIFRRVSEKYSPQQQDFYAQLFTQVKVEFPFFTSRDLRNIQRAIDGRIMDFDFPELWFEQPDTFFRQGYEQKMTMLVDLIKQNMKGLSFADIRLQETIRYLDGMAGIAQTGRERRIGELVEELGIRSDAETRYRELDK